MSGRCSPDDRERDYRRDDGWQKEPASTVLIKNVPDDVTERDLDRWFDDRDIRIRDIRLIPRKSGSRGAAFAFVEFHSVQASADWMNEQQGLMKLGGGHVSGLVYSRKNARSDYREHASMSGSDWTCPNSRCAFVNFAKRSECFRCTTPRHSRHQRQGRSDSSSSYQETDDGTSQVGANPCNTVVIRGLDGLTTEQSLLEALAAITSLEPKNCYVMRNFSTGVSLGYAFMEFNSVLNGKKIRDHFTSKQPLEVDGKLAIVDYAKNTYSTILASIQYQSMDQQPYDQYGQTQPPYKQTEYELQALAASSANQMSAIQQYDQQLQESAAAEQNSSQSTNGYSHLPQYPDPDVSKYRWDATTGYYYDDTTGLYYDSNSQYYYNMTTQEYMYWDGTAKTYIPVKSDTQQQQQQATADGKKSPGGVPTERDEKKSKAKSIAKEMEKWAKSQNKKSKATITGPPIPSAAPSEASTASSKSAADMAYDVLVGKRLAGSAPTPAPPTTRSPQDMMMPPPPAMAGMKRPAPAPSGGLVASYGGDDEDSETEDDPVNEANHIDRQKLTCNLCERKFNSMAILEKHVQMSDLHKQNLIKVQEKSQGQFTKQYRDRAKERRLKEGNTPRAGGFLKPSQFA